MCSDRLISEMSGPESIEAAIEMCACNNDNHLPHFQNGTCLVGMVRVAKGETAEEPVTQRHFVRASSFDDVRTFGHKVLEVYPNHRIVMMRLYSVDEKPQVIDEDLRSTFLFFWEGYIF